MFKYKSCPKCHGDVLVDIDYDGSQFEHCLQCGHRQYEPTKLTIVTPPRKRRLKRKAGRSQGSETASLLTDRPLGFEDESLATETGETYHHAVGLERTANEEGATMRTRAIKSEARPDKEYELVTDQNGWLLLMNGGQLLACFDPKEYTLSALCRDMETVMHQTGIFTLGVVA